ncbi:hypothetical protein DBB_42480 [Desulfoluna spongiiphila]|nr:hypothetical protein DBB_42480 [Desulfoluna spongiiphila]
MNQTRSTTARGTWRHVRHTAPTALACLLIFLFTTHISWAGPLPLPADAFEKLKTECAECLDHGVMICGNPNMAFGNHVKDYFFQGTPARGYLITPPLLAAPLKIKIRVQKDHAALVSTVMDDFKSLTLVAIGDSFSEVYRLPAPNVQVLIPKALHTCLSDPENRWGCGVSENRSKECCEKKLGSIVITATWIDRKNGETLELRYSPTIGSTTLVRRTQDNARYVYVCDTARAGNITERSMAP